MSHKIPELVRRTVRGRSGGVCEACGRARATEQHHRLYRSRGGADVVSNLLDLCGWGNHSGCHGVAHTRTGELRGLSIRSGGDPLRVRVEHALFGVVLLDDKGGWSPVPSGTDPWVSPVPIATIGAAAEGDWS